MNSQIFYVPIDFDSAHCFEHTDDFCFSWVFDDESYTDYEKKLGIIGLLYHKHKVRKMMKEVFSDKQPSGRYAMPQEIANMAVMLVSEMGNIVIGDTLYATGGSGVISLHN